MSRLPEPGETWNDRYEITAELGRGGFGRVYRAWDPLLERDVAIKLLRLSEDFTATDQQRFRREVNIAASLDHRNIVTVFDGGEHDGLLYLVMLFVPGRDLRHELADGPLAPERAASIVEQVGAALDYAHDKGLVHRDVKPGNVLCQSDSDTVFLADFGISRRVDQTTDNSVTKGLAPATVAYAAPEQMRTGVRVDGRADQYALGCVLFECLTGRKPFDGEIAAIITAHLHDPPPPVTDLRPGLPAAWDRVISTAMAKDRADRFERCAHLARAAKLALPSSPRAADDVTAAVPSFSSQTMPIARPRAPATGDLSTVGGRGTSTAGNQTPVGEGQASTARRRTPDDERQLSTAEHQARGGRRETSTAGRQTPADAPPGEPQRSRATAGAQPPETVELPHPSTAPPADRRSGHATAPAGDAAPRRGSGRASTAEMDDEHPAAVAMPGGSRPDTARREHRGSRRIGLVALAFVAFAALTWLVWPAVDGTSGMDDATTAADDEAGSGAAGLDDEQRALLAAMDAFDPVDCRPSTSTELAGQQVAVACASDDQAPTRVVFRRFSSTGQRDAALSALAGTADPDGDCRTADRATHSYVGAAGSGRVVCVVAGDVAGLSWTVPDQPIMGSARIDDPTRARELYAWWNTLVERSDG